MPGLIVIKTGSQDHLLFSVNYELLLHEFQMMVANFEFYFYEVYIQVHR